MDKSIGWIKLHRAIQDTKIWQEKRCFSKAEAWIDMLMTANFTDNEVLIGNQTIECRRGQSVLSLEAWAARWGWGVKKVRLFFDLLRSENMITTENVRKTTRLTICNYEVYQDEGQAKDTQGNSKGIQKEFKRATIKEREEVKERKERKEDLNYVEVAETSSAPPENSFYNSDKTDTTINTNSDFKKERKSSGQKKESEVHPATKPIRELYLELYPGYYWTAKDATNLKQIITKLEYSIKKAGKAITPDEVVKGAKYILLHLPEWMRQKNMTTIAHINSQFNSIVDACKAGTTSSSTHQKPKYDIQKGLDYIRSQYPEAAHV